MRKVLVETTVQQNRMWHITNGKSNKFSSAWKMSKYLSRRGGLDCRSSWQRGNEKSGKIFSTSVNSLKFSQRTLGLTERGSHLREIMDKNLSWRDCTTIFYAIGWVLSPTAYTWKIDLRRTAASSGAAAATQWPPGTRSRARRVHVSLVTTYAKTSDIYG